MTVYNNFENIVLSNFFNRLNDRCQRQVYKKLSKVRPKLQVQHFRSLVKSSDGNKLGRCHKLRQLTRGEELCEGSGPKEL